MFLIIPYKILPFTKLRNSRTENNKGTTSLRFDADNMSAIKTLCVSYQALLPAGLLQHHQSHDKGQIKRKYHTL